MKRIFVVKKTYEEPVVCSEENEAYEVFNASASEMDSYDSEIVCEIKTLADLKKCENVEKDTIPYGQGCEDKTIEELLIENNNELWKTRIPERIITADDVGCTITFTNVKIGVLESDIGRVIYKLSNGSFQAETDLQRTDRRTNKPDEVVAAEIKALQAKKMAEDFIANFNRLYPDIGNRD